MKPARSMTRRFRRLMQLPTADRPIVLAPLVGVISGLGAIAFHWMTILLSYVALGLGAGYFPGGPDGEYEIEPPHPAHASRAEDLAEGAGPSSAVGDAGAEGTAGDPPMEGPVASGEAGAGDVLEEGLVGELDGGVLDALPWDSLQPPEFRLWMLLVIPVIGAGVSGFLVYRFAPEAEGHGTDAAIRAFHHHRGLIKPRVPVIKMLSSAITIGTGGSAGREGPIAQIGAGFGSVLASRLKLNDHDRRVLMLSGVGAGIGAIFHAPLAGAIFAAEVLYADPDFEAEALIPAFISTTIAYCVFCLVFGFNTLFTVDAAVIAFTQPWLLLPLTVLAAAMAAAAWLYVRVFYGLHRIFKKLPMPRMTRPMLGVLLAAGLAIGGYLLLAPYGADAQFRGLAVLASGYGFLQEVLNPGPEFQTPMALLLLVGFGKILTTSLTISSGGSGGVFGPSMVIGGALGAAIGLAFHRVGLLEAPLIPMFAILGMASFFAAAANTPVSTLIMVSEMTGSYTLLLPSMWVCAISYLISRRFTLYTEQVASRLESPAHRGDFIIDILQGLSVRNAFSESRRDYVTVPLDRSLAEMGGLITDTRQICFPVVDTRGQYYGLFGLNDIRQFLYDSSELAELAVAQDLAVTSIEPLSLQMDLSSAMSRFAESRFEELPVVAEDGSREVIGLLRRQDVIATYSARLLEMRQSR